MPKKVLKPDNAETVEALQVGVAAGLIEQKGVDTDGEPLWGLSQKGQDIDPLSPGGFFRVFEALSGILDELPKCNICGKSVDWRVENYYIDDNSEGEDVRHVVCHEGLKR